MLLMTGELVGDPEQRASRWAELRRADPLIRELLRLYQDDPDPGIHAAAEWTLRRYEQEAEVAQIDLQLTSTGIEKQHQWYVSSQGHTMVVVPGPAQFAMGSPETERSRADDEPLHNRQITRSFSIASKETTVEQFQRFLRENPQVDHRFAGELSPSLDWPKTSVTWYEAAAYCNWLSKEEGVPEDQWCYVVNTDERYAAGMKIAPDYLYLRGYRLPTEAEWEYACRARATATWCFGNMEIYLEQYAVFHSVAAGQPLPVGSRKPNDFGLFDTHGNAAEWCQDLYGPYPGGRMVRTAAEDRIADDRLRALRGGSFLDSPSGVRSATRQKDLPGTRNTMIGFRVARSYP
jgi:formylglycine-generating enzyme required for sulfatase activity